ncbi:MAG: phosphomevalonate kinase [Myxococcales bacterium]|nr:phosphomevalonate kinase [Myxococcales bacterium]
MLDAMTSSAPGKLILTGEYAVLDGAPALVVAVDRRAVARFGTGAPRGSSAFLLAVATELSARRGADDPAARAAFEIAVDSSSFYDGLMKLGLGSSAAVTVAATALALSATSSAPTVDRGEVLAIASAAHAAAQGERGARGSGADIAAAVHGGTIAFTSGRVDRRRWPASVRLIPFFTGASADTASLVQRVQAARTERATEVDAALTAIGDASRAACTAVAAPADLAATAVIGAIALAAAAFDRLAVATRVDLVPDCVRAARSAMGSFGGTAKTTGAGGGDIGIAVIPATADVSAATRALIEAGCRPLQLTVDETGVDLRPDAS